MSQLKVLKFKESDLNQGLLKSIKLHKPLCICCLNKDTHLIDVRSCSHSYVLDNIIKLPLFSHMVCYHCHTMLVKIQLFKQQVEETFKILISEKDSPTNLQVTKLQMHKAVNISIEPNDINQKPTDCKKPETNLTEITLNDTEKSRRLKNISTALDILSRRDQIFGLELPGLKDCGLIAINKAVEALIAAKSTDSRSKEPLHAVSVSNEINNEPDEIEYEYGTTSDETPQASSDIDSSTTSLKTTECITVLYLTKEELLKERESLSQSKTYTELPYKCDYCLIGFNYEENLEDHIKRKHYQKTGSATCDVCLQTIHPPSDLEQHNHRHYTRFECNICKERFSLYDDAHCHYTTIHVSDNQNNCNLGEFNYRRKRRRCGEEIEYRNKVKTHRCTICYKVFSTRVEWKSHTKSHHGGELTDLNHICDYCGNIYKNRQEIFQHVMDHMKQRTKRKKNVGENNQKMCIKTA